MDILENEIDKSSFVFKALAHKKRLRITNLLLRKFLFKAISSVPKEITVKDEKRLEAKLLLKNLIKGD